MIPAFSAIWRLILSILFMTSGTMIIDTRINNTGTDKQ